MRPCVDGGGQIKLAPKSAGRAEMGPRAGGVPRPRWNRARMGGRGQLESPRRARAGKCPLAAPPRTNPRTTRGALAEPRVVLIVDLWHPELSEADRRAIRTLYPPGMGAAAEAHAEETEGRKQKLAEFAARA